MKILLIDVNYKNSSTGEIVHNLYSFLNEKDEEVAVCYGRGELIKEKNIYKFGLNWETYIHAFLTRITGLTGCFSYFSTMRLINYIEKFNPDVVHIHELHAYFVNIKQLLNYLAKKNIKVIHTLHCEFSYTGKCGYSIECERWKKECGSCPHLKNYPSTLFFDHTKFMFHQKKEAFKKIENLTIVTPSQWLADRAKQSFLKDKKIHVIHNGINTDIFTFNYDKSLREKHGIKSDEKVVISVAANIMSETKGGMFVKELSKRMPNIKFIIIGDDKEYVENNLISVGKIKNKNELSKYYSISDAFVICSKNENYPTTCLEAQSCGTPVVGFDVGGVKETMCPSIGFLLPYGDLKDLEVYVNKMVNIDKDSYIDELKKFRNDNSFENMCQQYLEIYKDGH